MSEPSWRCVPFAELTLDELYAALALRQRVFVVEQDCPYLDADGLDAPAWHLLGHDADGTLVAYARLLPGGTRYAVPSVGRVVTAPEVRRTGLGRALMREALDEAARLWGAGEVRLAAQRYLERFYGELGFRPTGDPYLEDGIPHIDMVRP